jgi:ribonucleotide monophosphatase NagD (HAD superfamily)
LTKRNLCTKWKQTPEFGLLFDIDGVIMRGNYLY